MSHKVYITNKQNTVKVPSGLRILIRRSCHAVLEAEHFEGPAGSASLLWTTPRSSS